MRRFTKKRLVGALGAVVVLAVAGAAIAYFTTSGSGSGSATVGTSSQLTLTGTTTGSLFPGTSVPVTISANNPSSGHQQVGNVTLTGVKACTNATNTSVWNGTACSNSGTEQTTCESSSGAASNPGTTNFYMAPIVSGQDVGTGNTTLTATGTLVMNNLSSSQDACKNANLYLTLSS